MVINNTFEKRERERERVCIPYDNITFGKSCESLDALRWFQEIYGKGKSFQLLPFLIQISKILFVVNELSKI